MNSHYLYMGIKQDSNKEPSEKGKKKSRAKRRTVSRLKARLAFWRKKKIDLPKVDFHHLPMDIKSKEELRDYITYFNAKPALIPKFTSRIAQKISNTELKDYFLKVITDIHNRWIISQTRKQSTRQINTVGGGLTGEDVSIGYNDERRNPRFRSYRNKPQIRGTIHDDFEYGLTDT